MPIQRKDFWSFPRRSPRGKANVGCYDHIDTEAQAAPPILFQFLSMLFRVNSTPGLAFEPSPFQGIHFLFNREQQMCGF